MMEKKAPKRNMNRAQKRSCFPILPIRNELVGEPSGFSWLSSLRGCLEARHPPNTRRKPDSRDAIRPTKSDGKYTSVNSQITREIAMFTDIMRVARRKPLKKLLVSNHSSPSM
jgi:hypothetical protein